MFWTHGIQVIRKTMVSMRHVFVLAFWPFVTIQRKSLVMCSVFVLTLCFPSGACVDTQCIFSFGWEWTPPFEHMWQPLCLDDFFSFCLLSTKTCCLCLFFLFFFFLWISNQWTVFVYKINRGYYLDVFVIYRFHLLFGNYIPLTACLLSTHSLFTHLFSVLHLFCVYVVMWCESGESSRSPLKWVFLWESRYFKNAYAHDWMGLAVFSVYYLRFYVPGGWILFGDPATYMGTVTYLFIYLFTKAECIGKLLWDRDFCCVVTSV
jgi:hypothetical protein